jgi:hypothetical protein
LGPAVPRFAAADLDLSVEDLDEASSSPGDCSAISVFKYPSSAFLSSAGFTVVWVLKIVMVLV